MSNKLDTTEMLARYKQQAMQRSLQTKINDYAMRGINHEVVNPRRLLLEKQLDLAIRRAEQNYLKVSKTKDEKPQANPSHLGTRIDIRV